MLKVFDMTSIRQKYPNRWLLLLIYSYEDGQPVSGRVLAYSKSRTKVYDARTRLRTNNSDLDLRIVFTGDQEELDKVSPELDLSLAMAEGEIWNFAAAAFTSAALWRHGGHFGITMGTLALRREVRLYDGHLCNTKGTLTITSEL